MRRPISYLQRQSIYKDNRRQCVPDSWTSQIQKCVVSSLVPLSINGNSTLPVTQAKKSDSSLTPLFLSPSHQGHQQIPTTLPSIQIYNPITSHHLYFTVTTLVHTISNFYLEQCISMYVCALTCSVMTNYQQDIYTPTSGSWYLWSPV